MNKGENDNFLQSAFWFAILANEGLLIVAYQSDPPARAIKHCILRAGEYQYFPGGPIFGGTTVEKKKELEKIFVQCKEAFPKTVFWRLEPSAIDLEIIKEFAEKNRFLLVKTIDLQPRRTLLLDLSKNINILEKELSQKTRYNIRLAAKKGVQVFRGAAEDFEKFWRLMKITGERDAFGIHSRAHYQNLLKSGAGSPRLSSGEAGNIELWLAEFDGQTIAAGLFCFFGNSVTYLHGASDNKFRNLMAPHLLQWSLITEAQKRGFHFYDFYGIDEKKWPGVTRFKTGFGGFVTERPGTYDLVFKKRQYQIYQQLRKFYRILRKLF